MRVSRSSSHLKGSLGDKLHAVLCAAGYNVRWLLRMISKKGLRAFLRALRAMAATTVRGDQRSAFWARVARLRLGHRGGLASAVPATACMEFSGPTTYVRTVEGWLYLACVLDLGTRAIVGWSMSERMAASLVCDALRMAYWRRKPAPAFSHTRTAAFNTRAGAVPQAVDGHADGSIDEQEAELLG